MFTNTINVTQINIFKIINKDLFVVPVSEITYMYWNYGDKSYINYNSQTINISYPESAKRIYVYGIWDNFGNIIVNGKTLVGFSGGGDILQESSNTVDYLYVDPQRKGQITMQSSCRNYKGPYGIIRVYLKVFYK